MQLSVWLCGWLDFVCECMLDNLYTLMENHLNLYLFLAPAHSVLFNEKERWKSFSSPLFLHFHGLHLRVNIVSLLGTKICGTKQDRNFLRRALSLCIVLFLKKKTFTTALLLLNCSKIWIYDYFLLWCNSSVHFVDLSLILFDFFCPVFPPVAVNIVAPRHCLLGWEPCCFLEEEGLISQEHKV